MKLNKKIMVAAAAGALAVAAAVPAMAIENEFYGSFMVKTFLSNFDFGTTSSQPNVSGSAWGSARKNNNYTETRTRLRYIAKASDDLKLVTQFEIDTVWGNTATSGSAGGGRIDTDAVNIEVKHAYLDFNLAKNVNVKVGSQAYKDTIKGLYVDADLPMLYVKSKFGSYSLGLGYSRFNDANASNTSQGLSQYNGRLNADLYALDNTFAFGKDAKATLSYYLNVDNSNPGLEKKVHTFGLGGSAKFGKLTVDGFAAMQAGTHRGGTNGASENYHGWAANAVAKMPVGPGTMKIGGLFVSGDNNGANGNNHDNGWQTLSSNNGAAIQNSYNDGSMMLLTRNTNLGGTNTDCFMRRPITNIALAHVGYDAKFTDKVSAMANVGMAWIPASTGTTTVSGNAGDYMGTEINMEARYKLYKNLTLNAQAAYVMLGSYYKNTQSASTKDSADPYTVRFGAKYAF